MTTTVPTETTRPAPSRGYWGAWATSPGSALYLVLVSLPFTVIALCVAWVTFTFGVGTLVIVLGVPVLAGALYAARAFGTAEIWLLRLTGLPPIAAPDWRRGTREGGVWVRMTQPFRNGHYWTALLSSMLVRLLVTLLTFTLAVVWIALALGGPSYWFWSRFIPNGNGESLWVSWAVKNIFGGIDPSPDTHLWASMLYLGVGIVFLVTLPLVLRGLSRLHHVVAAALVGRWESDDLGVQVAVLDASRGAALQAEDAGLRRLERDIHDGPQQRLVRLQMDLAALERRAAEGDAEAVAALAQESRGHAQAALDELRALAGGVAPPLLQDRGIVEALDALAAASPLHVSAWIDPAIGTALSPEAERNLYFVVSELLTNAAKHSGAATVSVTASAIGSSVIVTVRDDGRGGASARPGGGLEGLARRVQGLRGELRIISPAGGPTEAVVTVPASA